MKKIAKSLSVIILVLTMLCTAVPFGNAADVGTYVVTAEQTQMLSRASEEGAVVCDVFKGTVVEVTEVRLGFGFVKRKSNSTEGWIRMADLKSISADYVEDNIVGIEISLPDKLTYIVGEEEFDRTGLKVYAVYANNGKIEVTEYILSKSSFDTIGAKTIIVRYTAFGSGKTFQASFSVSVEKVPVRAITIEGNPKTEFVEGQTVSFDGIAVRVQYRDGRSDRLFAWSEIKDNKDFTFTVDGKDPSEILEIGKHTVRISYLYPEYAASYEIEALEKQPLKLEIIQLPYADSFYSDTRKPNLNGLVLRLIYTNNSSETVSYRDCELVFDADAAVLGDNILIVRYKGVDVQLTMRMIEPTLVGIEVADPGRTIYIKDAVFDGSGTVVNGIYDSGIKAELSNWEVHSFDTQTCGQKTVEIRYGEFSDSFTVYVTLTGYLNGDADLDGTLTAADARLILRHSVGLATLSGTALFAADRDEDGEISAADARLTLRAAVGLEPVYIENTQDE